MNLDFVLLKCTVHSTHFFPALALLLNFTFIPHKAWHLKPYPTGCSTCMNTVLSFQLPKCDRANIWGFFPLHLPGNSFEGLLIRFLRTYWMAPPCSNEVFSTAGWAIVEARKISLFTVFWSSHTMHSITSGFWKKSDLWMCLGHVSELIKKQTAMFSINWHVGVISIQEKHTQNTKWSMSIVNAWGRNVAARTNSGCVNICILRNVLFPLCLQNVLKHYFKLWIQKNKINFTRHVVSLIISVF